MENTGLAALRGSLRVVAEFHVPPLQFSSGCGGARLQCVLRTGTYMCSDVIRCAVQLIARGLLLLWICAGGIRCWGLNNAVSRLPLGIVSYPFS